MNRAQAATWILVVAILFGSSIFRDQLRDVFRDIEHDLAASEMRRAGEFGQLTCPDGSDSYRCRP